MPAKKTRKPIAHVRVLIAFNDSRVGDTAWVPAEWAHMMSGKGFIEILEERGDGASESGAGGDTSGSDAGDAG